MTMTTASLLARVHDGVVDEPDPAARPRRRSFTAEYKSAILDEYDALPVGSPDRGALLRREGLYTSHIAEWHKAREAGAREVLTPKMRGRRSSEQIEVERLRRRNKQLESELEHFEDLEAVASRATHYRRRRGPTGAGSFAGSPPMPSAAAATVTPKPGPPGGRLEYCHGLLSQLAAELVHAHERVAALVRVRPNDHHCYCLLGQHPGGATDRPTDTPSSRC